MARVVRQRLPEPPQQYDQVYIAQLAEAVNRYIFQREAQGEMIAGRYICTDMPMVPSLDPTTTPLATGTIYLKQTPALETASIDVASVTGTASTSWTMMGLHLQFTPTVSTQAQFTMDGQVGNSVNNGETDLTIVYGTGTPPANGAVVPAGATIAGQPVRFVATGGGGTFGPFSRTVLLTGLTPNTTYWVDIAMKVTAGTGSLTQVGVAGFGMFGSSGYFLTVVEQSDP